MPNDIKYSLSAGDIHPCQVIAYDVLQALPEDYVTSIVNDLEKHLQETEGLSEASLSMGVVVETVRRLIKNEKVNDRYVMGAALWLMSTLFNPAQMTAHAFTKSMATEESDESES